MTIKIQTVNPDQSAQPPTEADTWVDALRAIRAEVQLGHEVRVYALPDGEESEAAVRRVTHKVEVVVTTPVDGGELAERFHVGSVSEARVLVAFFAGRMNPEASLRIERTTTTVEVIS